VVHSKLLFKALGGHLSFWDGSYSSIVHQDIYLLTFKVFGELLNGLEVIQVQLRAFDFGVFNLVHGGLSSLGISTSNDNSAF